MLSLASLVSFCQQSHDHLLSILIRSLADTRVSDLPRLVGEVKRGPVVPDRDSGRSTAEGVGERSGSFHIRQSTSRPLLPYHAAHSGEAGGRWC